MEKLDHFVHNKIPKQWVMSLTCQHLPWSLNYTVCGVAIDMEFTNSLQIFNLVIIASYS